MEAYDAYKGFTELGRYEWFDFMDDMVELCLKNKDFRIALANFPYHEATQEGVIDIFTRELKADLEEHPFNSGLIYIKDEEEYFLVIQGFDSLKNR